MSKNTPPCDCIFELEADTKETYWVQECDCHNNGDLAEAQAWCTEQNVCQQLEKDAARYRWLRENPSWETEAFLSNLSPEEFDTAIDSAMGEGGDCEA